MPPIHKSSQVQPDQQGRADRVVQAMTGWTRRRITALFEHGCVSVNEQVTVNPAQRVAAGDTVAVTHDPARGYRPLKKPWKDATFRLVFEDEHLLVVEKSANVLTVPTPKGEENSLLDRVSVYLSHGRGQRHAFAAHRLDRGVSGLLVVAKSQRVADLLRDQFEARKPQREYIAIVAGHLKQRAGTFRSFLATADNLDRFSTTREDKGQLAVTHYQVEQELTNATLVRVKLETGRRNQIRVHFAEAGHPVLGDERYRPDVATQHPGWRTRRLALHAEKLGFVHPITGQAMHFESPWPRSFTLFLHGMADSRPPRKSAHPRPRPRKRGPGGPK